MLNETKRKKPPEAPAKKGGVDEFGLLIRERLFADYYLVDQNASSAYRLAGYTAKNDNVAAASASRMLGRAKVAAYIEMRAKVVRDALQITQERVLEEVARMAYFDPGKCFNSDGTLKALKDLDEDTRRAISGFDVVELGGGKKGFGVMKVRVEKSVALDKLMRYLRLFKEVEIPVGGTIVHKHEGTVKMAPDDAYRRMLGG